MRRSALGAMLLFTLAFSPVVVCQEPDSKWQVGTIMAVAPHDSGGQNPAVRQYDVSVKVGKTLYIVLYVPPDGTDTITHRTGIDLLVSVREKTIAFNNLLGKQMEVPILQRK